MKFTLNSLFGLTTVSAVVIGLIAVVVRVALESDAGSWELLALAGIGGLICALFGVLIGAEFVRQPLSTIVAAIAAFTVGATFAIGARSGSLFSTSVLGYCTIASVFIVVAACVARWWSVGKRDSFGELLAKRHDHGREAVLAEALDDVSPLPPIRR